MRTSAPKAPQAKSSPHEDMRFWVKVGASHTVQAKNDRGGPPWTLGSFERPHRGVPVTLELLLGEVNTFAPVQGPGVGVGADGLPPPEAVRYTLYGAKHRDSLLEAGPKGTSNAPQGIVRMGS